jgi:hypothetical protein
MGFTFWFFGSRVSECMPDQPRLLVWIVHLCFSSTGHSNVFLTCFDVVSNLTHLKGLFVSVAHKIKRPIDAFRFNITA